MEFPGYPYPDNVPEYPRHTDVWAYLTDFANHFELTDHIRLNHKVTEVSPLPGNRWTLVVKNMITNNEEKLTFDEVVVAVGYSKPFYPNIPGRKKFKEAIHSRYYRTAEPYLGKYNS